MLDVSGINGHVPQEMRALINDLRRAETSPITIHVQMIDGTHLAVAFYDERFPSTREGAPRIAVLRYEQGKFIIRSTRIKNRKFGGGSGGYHEFLTQDSRKMQKLLRQYIYPLTMPEIIDMTDGVGDKYYSWVNDPERDMATHLGGLAYTARKAVIEEVCHLRLLGVSQFKTNLFDGIFHKVLPLYDEHQRRLALKVDHVHVYVEADGKVSVTRSKNTPQPEWNTVKYSSLEQVPENIQQQVCMLKLVEQGKYLPEVGQRMADDIYWVHIISNP